MGLIIGFRVYLDPKVQRAYLKGFFLMEVLTRFRGFAFSCLGFRVSHYWERVKELNSKNCNTNNNNSNQNTSHNTNTNYANTNTTKKKEEEVQASNPFAYHGSL